MRKSKPNSRLGRVLLRSFNKPTKNKKFTSKRKKRPHYQAQLSFWRGDHLDYIELKKLRKKKDQTQNTDQAPMSRQVENLVAQLGSRETISNLSIPVTSSGMVETFLLSPLEIAVPLPSSHPLSVVENPPVAVEALASVPQQRSFDFHLSTQNILNPTHSLKQSIEAFLLDQRSPHTRKAYGKDLKRFIKFLHFRNYQQGLETINRALLIAYKEALIQEELEHTTIDRHISTLKSFFQWLVDDGHLDRSPADGVKFLNPKRISSTVGFSDQEVEKILKIPNLHTRTGSLHYAILMVLFYCGLRRSELCSLKTIHIMTERDQKIFRLRGKGNAERLIVIIPAVWNAIKHYFYITRRDFSRDEYLFVPVRNNKTHILNKPLDPSMIFYVVAKCSKQAGITNRVSPHSCRATAISNARDHNVPDRAIQEFAGWTSPDMITRYDKRKTSLEASAAHSISYGTETRNIPNYFNIEQDQKKSEDKGAG